jgi:intracellular sulfur oxidation DsrE/DsrF family protein
MFRSCFVFHVLLMSLSLSAQASNLVDQVLASDTPPPGVVFDVDEWDNDALQWAVPLIRAYVDRLRARFPDLEIAVVSHGEEEFALMKTARQDYPVVQHDVEELVRDQVAVHVCAGHAVMNGYSENNFVDFVDRVSAGVVTVAEYRRRGYLYIPVEQPR